MIIFVRKPKQNETVRTKICILFPLRRACGIMYAVVGSRRGLNVVYREFSGFFFPRFFLWLSSAADARALSPLGVRYVQFTFMFYCYYLVRSVGKRSPAAVPWKENRTRKNEKRAKIMRGKRPWGGGVGRRWRSGQCDNGRSARFGRRGRRMCGGITRDTRKIFKKKNKLVKIIYTVGKFGVSKS